MGLEIFVRESESVIEVVCPAHPTANEVAEYDLAMRQVIARRKGD